MNIGPQNQITQSVKVAIRKALDHLDGDQTEALVFVSAFHKPSADVEASRSLIAMGRSKGAGTKRDVVEMLEMELHTLMSATLGHCKMLEAAGVGDAAALFEAAKHDAEEVERDLGMFPRQPPSTGGES